MTVVSVASAWPTHCHSWRVWYFSRFRRRLAAAETTGGQRGERAQGIVRTVCRQERASGSGSAVRVRAGTATDRGPRDRRGGSTASRQRSVAASRALGQIGGREKKKTQADKDEGGGGKKRRMTLGILFFFFTSRRCFVKTVLAQSCSRSLRKKTVLWMCCKRVYVSFILSCFFLCLSIKIYKKNVMCKENSLQQPKHS